MVLFFFYPFNSLTHSLLSALIPLLVRTIGLQFGFNYIKQFWATHTEKQHAEIVRLCMPPFYTSVSSTRYLTPLSSHDICRLCYQASRYLEL